MLMYVKNAWIFTCSFCSLSYCINIVLEISTLTSESVVKVTSTVLLLSERICFYQPICLIALESKTWPKCFQGPLRNAMEASYKNFFRLCRATKKVRN